MKSFTDPDQPKDPIEFEIDGDVFRACPVIPAGAGWDLRAANSATDSATKTNLAGAVFDAILLPDSQELFARRVRDPERPITDRQIGRILTWLMEQYGSRPTTPAASSSTGLPAGNES